MESTGTVSEKWQDPNDTLLRIVRRASPIRDHEGNRVEIVWYPGALPPQQQQPAFSFQVYLTRNAANITVDQEFSIKLAAILERWRIDAEQRTFPFHLQIYSKHLPNVFSCARHQAREVEHRNRNGLCPRLVEPWAWEGPAQVGMFKHAFLVIDSPRWIDEGLLLVRSNPMDDPASPLGANDRNDADIFRLWHLCPASPGAIQPAPQVMRNMWRLAGHRWTEAYLRQHNGGGFPAPIYLAEAPMPLSEAENGGEQELGETSRTQSPNPENDGQNFGFRPLSPGTRVKRLLMQSRRKDRSRLATHLYDDIYGRSVTSVWDVKKSSIRPSFSVTLYLGQDLPLLDPKALFVYFDMGQLASKKWTLDIVTDMANIDAAWEHHRHISNCRSSEMLQIVGLITRAAGLPTELADMIMEYLVCPELPNYGRHHMQPMQNFFMYFDEAHLLSAPVMVYFDPILPKGEHDEIILGTIFTDENVCHTWMRVKSYRYSHDVSRELNGLWSLYSLDPSELGDGEKV